MENLVIIWLGWAWYMSSIYSARYNLKPILIWEEEWWMIVWNHMVENFPWFTWQTSGWDIMQKMRQQAEQFDVKIINDRVKSIFPIDKSDFKKWYIVETSFSWKIETKMLMLWIWTYKVKLWDENESKFFGKWVSYCATCDWFFYRKKTCAVIWWWDTALIETLYLSEICEKVYLIHRRNSFRWEPIRLERIKQKSNIEIITPSIITSLNWENKLESLNLQIWKDWENFNECNEKFDRQIKVDWLFVAIWTKPNKIEWLDEFLKRDNDWYIIVDSHQATNLDWVYSAWDCTTASAKFRQLVVACSEWAVASESAFQYYSKNLN